MFRSAVARVSVRMGIALGVCAALILGSSGVGANAADPAADPRRSEQWALDALQAEKAWTVADGTGTVVAVIDSGVNANHEDLQGQLLPQTNAFSGGSSPRTDEDGHGTSVIGIIAAKRGNDLGIAGLAPGAKVWPIRVMENGGGIYEGRIAGAIRRAIAADVDVINLSIGGSTDDAGLREAIQEAAAADIVVVAAAGNDRKADESPNGPHYPAAYPEAIGVAATTEEGGEQRSSHISADNDMAAPGAGVATTHVGGGYFAMSGTSAAAAYVSATAALLRSYKPNATAAEIRAALESSATDMGTPGRDDRTGWGQVNPVGALAKLGAPLSPDTYVASGASWRFHDAGTLPNAQWMQKTYSDVAWPQGSSTLGYGEANQATKVASGKVAYYFRSTFNAGPALSGVSGLELRGLIDDGAIVYLNGSEIWRFNMPAGAVTATTKASTAIAGTDESLWRTINVPASALSTGTNVIAVEVHNDSSSSSDVTMNLELKPIKGTTPPPPPVAVTRFVDSGATWKFRDAGALPDALWASKSYSDAAWPQGPSALGYGETNQATKVAAGKTAYYFRHAFNAGTSLDGITGLNVRGLFDDGAIVYVNGTEIWRYNMPAGAVTATTKASKAIAGTDESLWRMISAPASALTTGTNVISVEVHNDSSSSSDVNMDLELWPIRSTTPPPPPPVATTLVAPGASWRFSDAGTLPNAQWTSTTYSDSSWSQGTSALGYGETNQATKVASGKTAYYFRNTFNAGESVAGITGLELRGLIDDGAIVYLNGVEIWRFNMPAGAVSATTKASSAIAGSDEALWRTINVPASALTTGTNVISVEVHNDSSSSSDVTMNLELKSVL